MILASASALTNGLSLAAALGYLVPTALPLLGRSVVFRVALAAWCLHGILLADAMSGDAPRFGFAPVLSITIWLVIAVHTVESRFVPLPTVRLVLAPAGAVSIVGAGTNLVAVTVGNMAGGTLLVAGVYWVAYLRGGRPREGK